MMIRRVGIVAKHNLVAASEHVSRLGIWLRARDVEAVYETETATLAGAAVHGARTLTRETLPYEVDLIIVLGGGWFGDNPQGEQDADFEFFRHIADADFGECGERQPT